MSGRHRPFGGESGRRVSRAPIAFAAVAALVALTVVAVRAVAADARGCSKGVTLSVAAAPDLAPVLREAATRWTATNPKVAKRRNSLRRHAGAMGSLIVLASSPAMKPRPTQRWCRSGTT